MGVRSCVVTWNLLSVPGVSGRPLIEAQVYEEAMQLLECTERNFRRTQLHSRACRGIQHPRRQDRSCAIGQLAHGHFLPATVLTIRDLDDRTKGGVPGIMHLGCACSDMGTINGDL